jgi:hypothetical protein
MTLAVKSTEEFAGQIIGYVSAHCLVTERAEVFK